MSSKAGKKQAIDGAQTLNQAKGQKRKLEDSISGKDDISSSIAHLDEHSQKIIRVKIMMKEREIARRNSDFAKSDSIREKLKEIGVDIKDQKDGPSGWKFIDGRSNKLPNGIRLPEELTKKALKQKTDVSKNAVDTKVVKKIKDDITSAPSKSSIVETQKNMSALNAVQSKNAGEKNVQGVIIVEKSIGTGSIAETGKRVKVHYTGRLKSNNRQFDSSVGKKPFEFRLGRGEVIRGWDIGVAGMRIGGKRTLTIPPEKGYGKQGAPPTIPGNATLVFDVTLLEVK